MDILCIKLQLCEIKRFLPMPNIVLVARTLGIIERKTFVGSLYTIIIDFRCNDCFKSRRGKTFLRVQNSHLNFSF